MKKKEIIPIDKCMRDYQKNAVGRTFFMYYAMFALMGLSINVLFL